MKVLVRGLFLFILLIIVNVTSPIVFAAPFSDCESDLACETNNACVIGICDPETKKLTDLIGCRYEHDPSAMEACADCQVCGNGICEAGEYLELEVGFEILCESDCLSYDFVWESLPPLVIPICSVDADCTSDFLCFEGTCSNNNEPLTEGVCFIAPAECSGEESDLCCPAGCQGEASEGINFDVDCCVAMVEFPAVTPQPTPTPETEEFEATQNFTGTIHGSGATGCRLSPSVSAAKFFHLYLLFLGILSVGRIIVSAIHSK